MKVRTYLLLIMLALVGALALAACGGGDGAEAGEEALATEEATAPTEAETDAAPTESETGEAADGTAPVEENAEPLDVRVITAIPVNVGIWDPGHNEAYMALAEERGWDIQIAEAVPYGEAAQVLSRWGEEGVDVVFSTDNGFEDSFLQAAEAYPDTYWAMMSDLSTTNDLPNVASYSINWCQLGFAIGSSAAVVSETGTVGLVGALPILPQILMLEGERFGAEQAVPGTEVITQDSGDFVDAAKAQETAIALLDAGADVIFTAHGGPIGQIATAAAERDKYFIGYLADSTDFAPDAVVTSVVVDFIFGYERVADQIESGTFEAGIFKQGLEEDAIEVLPFRLGFEDRRDQVLSLLDQLEAGEITFPENGECAGGGQ